MSPSQPTSSPSQTQSHCPTCRTESADAFGPLDARLRAIEEKLVALLDTVNDVQEHVWGLVAEVLEEE